MPRSGITAGWFGNAPGATDARTLVVATVTSAAAAAPRPTFKFEVKFNPQLFSRGVVVSVPLLRQSVILSIQLPLSWAAVFPLNKVASDPVSGRKCPTYGELAPVSLIARAACESKTVGAAKPFNIPRFVLLLLRPCGVVVFGRVAPAAFTRF